MSWVISGSEKNPVDLFRSNVSLLLHGNGSNGSTAFTDNSPTPKTVTGVGNAQISTAQSKFGGASIAFDGTGDYLSVPQSSEFSFGSNDFTVEFWLRVTAVPVGITLLLDFRSAGSDIAPALYLEAITRSLMYFTNNANRITGSSMPLATWAHIALSRSAGSTKLFIDGVQTGSTYTDANSYVSSVLKIGAGFNNADSLNGYIDDLRITKGVARYTANFTPPTAAFPDI
jgi:hypothetical protein